VQVAVRSWLLKMFPNKRSKFNLDTVRYFLRKNSLG
jgi:hypothetical protein